jgi:hypothetical protein
VSTNQGWQVDKFSNICVKFNTLSLLFLQRSVTLSLNIKWYLIHFIKVFLSSDTAQFIYLLWCNFKKTSYVVQNNCDTCVCWPWTCSMWYPRRTRHLCKRKTELFRIFVRVSVEIACLGLDGSFRFRNCVLNFQKRPILQATPPPSHHHHRK